MIDDTVLKIALAGLLHDIGKFAEDGMTVSPEFLDGNAGLYQPYFNNHYTHRHAVYTAAFIDHIEKLLPRQLNQGQWGLEDTFVNLAAGHHKPETPFQWLIAVADRISSGWDRNNFDSEYNQAVAWQDYRQTRLLPVFERLLRNDKTERKDYVYSYSLREITPESIFPQQRGQHEPASDEDAAREYKALFLEFADALEKLFHRDVNVALWFEHLDSLLLIYTAMIPAARAGKILPDVSLYDHCRVVSAIASALYLYHRDTDSMMTDAIQDYEPEKFLLIGGDFYGIQNFIFSDSGEAGKHRAKILRGRSFAVSLYSELAADMLCREIGLPCTSVLLNAAGKFTIIAPNLQTTIQAMKSVEDRANRWLMDIAYGETAIGISSVPASPADFTASRFVALWDRLAEKMAMRKYKKFDLDQYGGPVIGYLDGFRNDLNPPLCPYCGRRPSDSEASAFNRKQEDRAICRICRDHIFLGENLVKQDRIAITTKDADIKGVESKLLSPIYDEYQVAFIGGGLNELAKTGKLRKYWDISISTSGRLSKEVAAKFLNGYVPVYSDADLYDDRYLSGKKSDERKEQLIEDIRDGRPKSFSHIAARAQNDNGEGDCCGIQAIGVLKADVDRLGMLISCGLEEKEFTISRLATLSRQMNFFFAVYLPHLLKTDPPFVDVYTVFAGGDDLLLIGPWNRIMDLAGVLQVQFADFTCQNSEIHFSAGICLKKPNTPLRKLALDVEQALEASKDRDRNKITVFGETVTWEEYARLRQIKETMKQWQEDKLINNAMLFRLNVFIDLANLEREVIRESGVNIEDMECLKWRSLFRYMTERNIGKQMKDETDRMKAREQFGMAAKWLDEFGGRLRIALWDLIYNQR
ncbi:MAG: type III-A CRISPR-associated protein Cas10/Csm1 [Syntrophales bacterium]|jgi:CRISPR-associated protein Csm1|nr:type III-A CRISPR-associated protein Cas10/Csm1 [Syntrophales bacterium]